jgi:hypothetical protein
MYLFNCKHSLAARQDNFFVHRLECKYQYSCCLLHLEETVEKKGNKDWALGKMLNCPTCSCFKVGSVHIVPSGRMTVVIAATKYLIGNPVFSIAMHAPFMQHDTS